MTTNYTFEMTSSQVENIIVSELQDSLKLNLAPNKDEGEEYIEPDFTMITALTQVLSYYMPFSEYSSFYNELKSKIHRGKLSYKKELIESLYKWE